MKKRIEKVTYYSRPRIYGGCYFVMVNDEKQVFSQGLTCSCTVNYQAGPQVENLTQKQLKQQVASLLELGYTEVTNREYYDKGYHM